MNHLILDTNVFSELAYKRPNPNLMQWFSLYESETATTSISIHELYYGVLRLPQGRQRATLHAWAQVIEERYTGQIIDFDVSAAKATAQLRAEQAQKGRTLPYIDSLIAGICLSRGATLVTRNTKDFEGLGVLLVNPFTHTES